MTLWALALFFYFILFIYFFFSDILLTREKCPNFQRSLLKKYIFSRIYSEVNQVIYSFILPINLPSFKALAPTVFFFFFFEILLTREKCSKLQRAITNELFFKIYLKVKQVVYSSVPVDSSGFKALV